jgi:hypothetical protein
LRPFRAVALAALVSCDADPQRHASVYRAPPPAPVPSLASASAAPAPTPTPSVTTERRPWVGDNPPCNGPPAAMRFDAKKDASPASAVLARAREALSAIAARDMRRLSSVVHPEKGILFSANALPNCYVVRYSREELLSAMRDPARRIWGQIAEAGPPPPLHEGTFAEFLRKWLYDGDYARARDDTVDGSGTEGKTGELAQTYFPEARIVEFHIPSPTDGMDWRSLRLVFEGYKGALYLVAALPQGWTI